MFALELHTVHLMKTLSQLVHVLEEPSFWNFLELQDYIREDAGIDSVAHAA